MGNKRAREFQKRSAVEAEWERVRSDKRQFFEDVSAFGIGARRLTVIHCPSFREGYGWDIRELDDGLRIFRSNVCSESTTLSGYDLLQFPSASLREYLERLRAIKIDLHPTGGCGFDGTRIYLGLYSNGWSSIQLSWWGAAQGEWYGIAEIV